MPIHPLSHPLGRPLPPRRRPLRGASLSILLLLGACAIPQQPGASFSGRAGSGHAAPGDNGGAARGALPSPSELVADPSRFKGFAASDLTATLGDPNYRRREAPAEVWQYYGSSCVLDLFLYEEGGAKRVTYVELRNRSMSQDGVSSCLSELLDGRRGQQSS